MIRLLSFTNSVDYHVKQCIAIDRYVRKVTFHYTDPDYIQHL